MENKEIQNENVAFQKYQEAMKSMEEKLKMKKFIQGNFQTKSEAYNGSENDRR